MKADEAKQISDKAYQTLVADTGLKQYYHIIDRIKESCQCGLYNYNIDMYSCNQYAEKLLKEDGYKIDYYDDYKTEYCSISWL